MYTELGKGDRLQISGGSLSKEVTMVVMLQLCAAWAGEAVSWIPAGLGRCEGACPVPYGEGTGGVASRPFIPPFFS